MRSWTITFSNSRAPLVVKGKTFCRAIETYLATNNDLSYANLSHDSLYYANLNTVDLRDVDLSNADLRYANLSYSSLYHANLSGADLSNADLSYTNLINADLSNADLRYASLRQANLSNANLTGAKADYSCLPLFCGSLDIKIDKRIACQLLYHTLRAMQSVDDAEVKAILNNDRVIALANQFHRIEECGRIVKKKSKLEKLKEAFIKWITKHFGIY